MTHRNREDFQNANCSIFYFAQDFSWFLNDAFAIISGACYPNSRHGRNLQTGRTSKDKSHSPCKDYREHYLTLSSPGFPEARATFSWLYIPPIPTQRNQACDSKRVADWNRSVSMFSRIVHHSRYSDTRKGILTSPFLCFGFCHGLPTWPPQVLDLVLCVVLWHFPSPP